MEILGIGDRLRTLRTHRKMTIKQVSERLGISASVLSEYELDVKNPSYRNLLRFARYIMCPVTIFSETKSASL